MRKRIWGPVALVILLLAHHAGAKTARFLDSDEAKEAKYKRGCAIDDFSDVVEADGINWAWTDPMRKIGGAGPIEIQPIKNLSDVTDSALAPKVEEDFKQAFERIGKSPGKGGLRFKACIYWVERSNPERAMIPWAGMHLMQAGVGIEAVMTDAAGKTIAKLRHDGRQGQSAADAAAEVVDDIANFVRDH